MKIILTGGGTGGHVYPNLSLLSGLKDFEFIGYIGGKGGVEERLAKEFNLPFFPISPPKFLRKLSFENLMIPKRLAASVATCVKILKNVKPSVVFSKGGYIALPTCIAAKKLGIPVVCHESDSSLGLANKMSLHFSEKMLTAFPMKGKKFLWVGNPIRKEIFEKSPKIFKKRLVLLVLGGSLGAKTINDSIFSELDEILKTCDVIHITGKGKTQDIQRENYLQLEFSDKIWEIYQKADLVISRGGANALFELLALKKPTICVPLEKGSRGDQVKNGEYFEKLGCLMLVRESDFARNVMKSLKELMNQKDIIVRNIEKLTNLDGREKICQILCETGQKFTQQTKDKDKKCVTAIKAP